MLDLDPNTPTHQEATQKKLSETIFTPAPTKIKNILFSFKGRINRKKYWIALLLTFLISIPFGMLTNKLLYKTVAPNLEKIAEKEDEKPTVALKSVYYPGSNNFKYDLSISPVKNKLSIFNDSTLLTEYLVHTTLYLFLFIPFFWAYLSLSAKRWHDRDKSGWWIFTLFIPIIGFFWFCVEQFLFKGTEGNNRFGIDPLDN